MICLLMYVKNGAFPTICEMTRGQICTYPWKLDTQSRQTNTHEARIYTCIHNFSQKVKLQSAHQMFARCMVSFYPIPSDFGWAPFQKNERIDQHFFYNVLPISIPDAPWSRNMSLHLDDKNEFVCRSIFQPHRWQMSVPSHLPFIIFISAHALDPVLVEVDAARQKHNSCRNLQH